MSSGYKYPGAAENAHFQQQRSMFLPIMLCSRSSLKDVKISHRRSSSSSENINHNKSSSIKYTKLRRFFFTKSLSTNPTSQDLKSRRTYNMRSNCKGNSCNIVGVSQLANPINLSNLDPPLPPPLKHQQRIGQGPERESLWKRRSGEASLKSLQLLPIHGGAHNHRCLEPKTV